jgi:hypothetical protein
MQTLKRRLQEKGIEVSEEKALPDGSRRLTLRLPDNSPLEVVLTAELLRGTRAAALAYIEELVRTVSRTAPNKHS